MLRRALKRFERYPERYFGFELGAHRAELRGWLDRIAAAQVRDLTTADRPRWNFGPPVLG
jgi:hypothetical protein